MQYTSLPDGFTIQELDASHLEQFNALLRYAFQVTEAVSYTHLDVYKRQGPARKHRAMT